MKKVVLLLTFFSFLAFFSLTKAQVYHPNLVDDYLEDISSCEGINETIEVNETVFWCGFYRNDTYKYWTQHKMYLLNGSYRDQLIIRFTCNSGVSVSYTHLTLPTN